MQLDDIKRTIKSDWDAFQPFYREQMRSSVSAMDLFADYIYAQKGKQLRPLLVFLSAALNGGINRRTYAGAAMVELIHTGTLLHDDVLDEAVQRRGQLTVNAHWQSKTAIIAGDFMFVRGLQTAMENNASDLLQIIAAAVQEIGEGEAMQMQKSQELDISEQLYFEIIRKKTASLLQACMHIGTVTANAADSVDTMKSAGNLLGIAFQIRDDVLDYHSEKQTGKKPGNDIIEKKLTLPLIFALQKTDARRQRRILEQVSVAKDNPRNVTEIMDFVRNSDGIRYADDKARQYVEQAKAMLCSYPASPCKDALLALADYFVLRDK